MLYRYQNSRLDSTCVGQSAHRLASDLDVTIIPTKHISHAMCCWLIAQIS